MKRQIITIGKAVFLVAVLSVALACNKTNEVSTSVQVSTFETASLQYMREEEKLARDVYERFYAVHGLPVFVNTSQSEQTHMDAIQQLLVKFDIADPIKEDNQGSFTNPVLQELYGAAINTGNVNPAAALRVGATIEDLDLFDLTRDLSKVSNPEIVQVYNSLAKGSRNHLRVFYQQLFNLGETYVPQYISTEAFEAIINSPMETGP